MKQFTYQSNDEDVEAILTHLVLNIEESGIGNSLGINLESLKWDEPKSVIAECGLTHVAEVLKILLIASSLHASPGLLRKQVGHEVQVKLAVGLAINCLVTFEAAILANIGGTIRALSRRVALLLANTASTSEDTRVGAVGLGVSVQISVISILKIRILESNSPFFAAVEASSHRLTGLGALGLPMAEL
jgi:hypothetical protein